MLTAGDSIVLEAFLNALVQLDQPLDEATEKALIQVIENLETLAQNSPPLKQEYDKARLELVKNYQSQSRLKFVPALAQNLTSAASQSVSEPNQEPSLPSHVLAPNPRKKTPLEIFEEHGLIDCVKEEVDSKVNVRSVVSDYLIEKQKQGRL